MFFKGPEIIYKHLKNPITDTAELEVVNKLITLWRARLYDLSWFMSQLNEYIAKRANAEDSCTGH